MNINYKNKYLKYKNKYLYLKNNINGGSNKKEKIDKFCKGRDIDDVIKDRDKGEVKNKGYVYINGAFIDLNLNDIKDQKQPEHTLLQCNEDNKQKIRKYINFENKKKQDEKIKEETNKRILIKYMKNLLNEYHNSEQVLRPNDAKGIAGICLPKYSGNQECAADYLQSLLDKLDCNLFNHNCESAVKRFSTDSILKEPFSHKKYNDYNSIVKEICNYYELSGNYLIISPSMEPKKIGPKVSDKIILGDKIFNRIGYVIHKGNDIRAGHYISIIKKNNKWYKLDDSQSPEICDLDKKEFNGKHEQPYLVFYMKEGHKQYDDIKIRKEPIGLNNLGDTCFLNAVMQNLLNNGDFYNFIMNN